MKHLARLFLLLSLLVAIPALPGTAHACPNCKEAYSETDGSNIAAGYNTSILLMVGMPMVLLGGLALRVWWTAARTRRAAAASPGAGSDIDTRIDPQP